jgi:putative ABC transport system substrate-binding protein
VLRLAVALLALVLLAAPLAAEAQQARKAHRIGWLTPTALEGTLHAFREALRGLGQVEGQTVAIELRSAEDDLARLPRLAAELVQSRVDVIVAVSPPAILAARHATDAIPIVMSFWGGTGLIESGMVASFARPGGNVTGVHVLAAELDAKRLELLLQAVPRARRVGVLDPVAGAVGALLHAVVVGREGYQQAVESLAKAQVDVLLVPSFPRFFKEAPQIIELADATITRP